MMGKWDAPMRHASFTINGASPELAPRSLLPPLCHGRLPAPVLMLVNRLLCTPAGGKDEGCKPGHGRGALRLGWQRAAMQSRAEAAC